MSWTRVVRRIRRRWRARRPTPQRPVTVSEPEPKAGTGNGWWNLVALYLTMSLAVGFAVALVAVGRGSSTLVRATAVRKALSYAAGQLVPTTIFLFESEDGLPRQALETGLPMLLATASRGKGGAAEGWSRTALAAISGIDLHDPRSLLASQIPLARGRDLAESGEAGLSTDPRTSDSAAQSTTGGPQPELGQESETGQGSGPGQTVRMPPGSGAVATGAGGPLVRQQGNIDRLKGTDWGTDPLIAVYHTHSSETFHGPAGHGTKSGYSEADYAWGQTSGVISVGDEFVRVMTEEYRIPTVHSRNIHDYPVFRNAYANSAATIKSILARYPSVKLVIDLHRDGIATPTDDSITAVMAGERLARLAFIVGQGQPQFPNPHWERNQALAQDLHNRLEKMYPGLSRGVAVRKWPYNQELSEGGLLVEVGDHYNTRAEAMRAAALLADVVADAMKERLRPPAESKGPSQAVR